MRREIRVTLTLTEVAAILAKHFDVETKGVGEPTLVVYAQTDRYDNELGHTFVFTAETTD